MNGAHLHLAINHLPVAGALFSMLVLLWAWGTKSRECALLGMTFLVLLGGFAAAAYFTGEPAEEAVENLPTVPHSLVERHESAAAVSFVAAIAAGLVGLLGWAFRKSEVARGRLVIVGLACTLIVFGLMAWTANLGGVIRHTEIRSNAEASGILSEFEAPAEWAGLPDGSTVEQRHALKRPGHGTGKAGHL